MDALDGRTAVVTGAADGIGLALSRALAAEGMNLVMADIDGTRLGHAVAQIGPLPGRAVIGIPTDVSDAPAVRELERRARERFGAIHLLCNNAGVQAPGRVWKIPSEDFAWLLGVNLWGVIHGIQTFVPAMLEHGEPAHIVNTASISGVLGFPRIGAYATSKFAVVGLSESLLLDLRERGASIGVSVLCPGAVATALGTNSERLRRGAAARSNGDDDNDADDGGRMAPEHVASQVIEAILADRFWVLTHPGYRELLEARHQAMLGGQASLATPGFSL
jgi:NAD(P)-dependent dehydrogenase (short-subunit alcohol dehydrogenase family)